MGPGCPFSGTVLNCFQLKGAGSGGRSGLCKRFMVRSVALASVMKVFAHTQLSTGERMTTRVYNSALLSAGAGPGTTPSAGGLTQALIPLFDLQVRQQQGPRPDFVSAFEPVLRVERCRALAAAALAAGPHGPPRPHSAPPAPSLWRSGCPCFPPARLLLVMDVLVWRLRDTGPLVQRHTWNSAPGPESGVAAVPVAGSPPTLCLDRFSRAASSPGRGWRD